jgi:hypothetical protein
MLLSTMRVLDFEVGAMMMMMTIEGSFSGSELVLGLQEEGELGVVRSYRLH